MLFDPLALDNKRRFLDAILHNYKLLEKVVSNHITSSYRFVHLPRVWNPGGGSTLFRIESSTGNYFLKVKHRSVYVESKLECETDYIRKSSLLNEYQYLTFLDTEWVPKIIFFDERDSFQFLAIEWLDTFYSATKNMSAATLYQSWEKLENAARFMFQNHLVHSDIHEHNICFRGEQPVICDFEEARFLRQKVAFENSLDVAGLNRYGNVGQFPTTDNATKGFTCLNRLKIVYKGHLQKRLPRLISESNFDDTCPYNLDKLQKPNKKTYQSLDFKNLHIAGQRQALDSRVIIFRYVLFKLARQKGPINHLDVGSNIGLFCFEALKYRFVKASSGIEAYLKFIEVSKIIAFLYDFDKAEFFHAECGVDDIKNIGTGSNLITMLSVYHHVTNKRTLLEDIRKISSDYLLCEFATQDRYYADRGGLLNEILYIITNTGYSTFQVVHFSNDYRRPIILFSKQKLSVIDLAILRLILRFPNKIAILILHLIEKYSTLHVRLVLGLKR